MPASVGPILMLWAALLLPGGEPGPMTGAGRTPTPRLLSSVALVSHPVATIGAMTPGTEWPWRLSEADTSEEETDEGDHLGPLLDAFSKGRLHGDRGTRSPIRPDRGSFRSPFRSPILRC